MSPRPHPPFKSCPCGSGRSYAACCRPAHDGTLPPPTPETLMRARYSAFALGDAAFVRRTWHPEHRPADLNLDDGTRYLGLKIHDAQGDEVEFTVRLRAPGQAPGSFRERSRFARLDGEWVYVDGDFVA